MKKYITQRAKKVKLIYKNNYVYSRWTLKRYLIRYKRIRKKYFWKKRLCRIYGKSYSCRSTMLAFLSFRKYQRIYKKDPHNKVKRFPPIIRFYNNFSKIWHYWIKIARLRKKIPMLNSLWPRWKVRLTGVGLFTDETKLKFYKFFRLTKWLKLRKRWLWHRLIKWSVKVKFLSNLKKYFAYNIAVRKYFNYQINYKYKNHGRILFQQAPYFLVQRRIVPTLKQAKRLCQWKQVNVNGMTATVETKIKPYDIVSFRIYKTDLQRKYNRYKIRRKLGGSHFGLDKGLIYNKKLKAYIFYKNINLFSSRTPINYLYYYYYHRNLLQGCRMR